jgi:hypothetical protein
LHLLFVADRKLHDFDVLPEPGDGGLHESGWVKKRRERKRLAAEFCTIF